MSMVQILKLKPAFNDDQAQALAGLFDEDLATKRDIEALRLSTAADIEALRLSTKSDIEALRVATKSDLDKLRAELKADTDQLKLELSAKIDVLRLETQRDAKATEARLVGWIFGQGVAVIGILFALLRFVEK